MNRRDQRSTQAQAYRAWYNTQRWKARRATQLSAHPLCAMCLQQGRYTPATVADHKTPHKGDPDLFWRGELQSLCAPHHDSAKQADERRGYSAHPDADGWPSDPQHPANRG